MTTILALRLTNGPDFSLALSEDHAFIGLCEQHEREGKNSETVSQLRFAEIAYPSPADAAKRGGPLPIPGDASRNAAARSDGIVDHSWLYMHGGKHAWIADTPELIVAAMVANIQPTPKGAKAKDGEDDNETLAVLKRELLWTLRDHGIIDDWCGCNEPN